MSNAPALLHLRAQVNAKVPNRATGNDGLVGDERHKNKKSDHNENYAGVVTAIDITHDPRHGFDSYAYADYLRTHPDKRVQYIISNHRIWNPDVSPEWRPFHKAPHDLHVHISLRQLPKYWNDVSDWDLGPIGTVNADAPAAPSDPLLRRRSKGPAVREAQQLLGVTVDGDFGGETEAAVRAFQVAHGLQVDGKIGSYTWRALRAAEQPKKLSIAPTYAFDIGKVIDAVASHPVVKFEWPGRGRAPIGYVKGMAVSYANMLLKLRSNDPIAQAIAAKMSDENQGDALEWYELRLGCFGFKTRSNFETLRTLFILLYGLGMRESSGVFSEGRDRSADNVSGDSAEAGLFQQSWDSHTYIPLLTPLMQSWKGDGYIGIYSEGVHPDPDDLKCYGSGAGLKFQKLCKSAPDFAVQAAALGLRTIGAPIKGKRNGHWGPINRREVTVRIEVADMLDKVEQALSQEVPTS